MAQPVQRSLRCARRIVVRHIRQYRGLVVGAAEGVAAAADECRAPCYGIATSSSTLASAAASIRGPCSTPRFHAVADLQLRHRGGKLMREGVVNAILHQQPVGADAGLAGVAVLRSHRALDGGVEIGIVEHDERRVATELQRHALERRRALRRQHAADLGRAGEGHLAYQRIGRSAHRRWRAASPVTTLKTPAGTPARAARSAIANADSGVCIGGLDDDGAARGERRSYLARDHGGRKIPGRNGSADTDRLAHNHDALHPATATGWCRRRYGAPPRQTIR